MINFFFKLYYTRYIILKLGIDKFKSLNEVNTGKSVFLKI